MKKEKLKKKIGLKKSNISNLNDIKGGVQRPTTTHPSCGGNRTYLDCCPVDM